MNNSPIDKAIELIPNIQADLFRRLPFVAQKLVGLEMNFQGKQDSYPKNTTKTLNIRSGMLFRSFTPNDAMNIARQEGNRLVYGTKVAYAAIHEHGGTIQHPGSSKKQAWMGANGLVVRYGTKPHPITIQARPYLAPAMKKLEDDELPKLLEQVFQPIRELFA